MNTLKGYKNAHTTIFINGTVAQTLLDTGSPISIIPYELVDAAGFAEHVYPCEDSPQYTDYQHNPIPILG